MGQFKEMKKLRSKEYSLDDLRAYLDREELSLLFLVLFTIAEQNIQDSIVVSKLIRIASGEFSMSNKGMLIYQMRHVAIATLKLLGYDEIYQKSKKEDQEIVDRLLDDNDWKSIKNKSSF